MIAALYLANVIPASNNTAAAGTTVTGKRALRSAASYIVRESATGRQTTRPSKGRLIAKMSGPQAIKIES